MAAEPDDRLARRPWRDGRDRDGAVPRRVTLKVRFDALDLVRAALAFQRILGAIPPGRLPEGLTPGDFAIVRYKAELLAESCPAILARWRAKELTAKTSMRAPIGFQIVISEPETPEPRLQDAA